MKRFGIITIFVFLMTILVASAISLTPSSTLELDGKQAGETATGFFTITNNGVSSVSLSISLQNANDFEDIAITLSPSSLSLNSGESKNVSISANIASKVDSKTYDGNIIINDGTTQSTLKLVIPVDPEVCDEGKQPSSVNLNLADWELKENPETDEKDEYYPGDKVVVQSIKVENNGDEEITDIVVEAILYDLTNGDNLESAKSETFNLNDGDDDSVDDLEFNIPADADEEDEYAIYLKVYEDGEEDSNCNYELMPITITKRSRDMEIDLTNINPQTAKCGDSVAFSVNVKNTGSKDDSSVFVKIQDPAYKITGQTAVFSLDSDDETTKIVSITLPKELTAQVYSIEAAVIYSGTTARSDFGNLTVTCEAENRAPVANAGVSQSVEAGNIVTLNGASSSDPDNNQLTYLWTQVGGMAVQLSSPTSAQTTFTPNVADTYTFKLDVSDGKLTSSATTSIVVQAAATSGTDTTTYQPTGIMDLLLKDNSLQQLAWVLAILVLLLIAVYLIKLIFFPPKKKIQMPMHNIPTPQPEFPE